MRFKLTVVLVIANIAMLFSIWLLERKTVVTNSADSNFMDFTSLEITGKTIEKPRILKLENNRWKIVSPIEWPANYYAVNRIKNQLEYLDKDTSFPISDLKKHGQSLADYGLDDPIFTFKYSDGKNEKILKIGKNAPVGDRVYMQDVGSDRIIIADKSFIDSFSSDIDALRGQNVFDIPKFEVSSFSIRLSDADSALRSNLRRIGLVRDGDKWHFETPIVANADGREVGAFLDMLCSISARRFVASNTPNTGLDMTSFPTAITLQGTNRKQTLLLGNTFDGGKLQYARLEENPTIFVVEASLFANLGDLQTTLRDKSFLKFDELDLTEINVSSRTSQVRLKKLTSGMWDLSGKDATVVTQADFALVNTIISKLKDLRARTFVTDAPGDNISRFGFDNPVLKISLKQSTGAKKVLLVGNSFKDIFGELYYAKLEGEAPIYGILPNLVKETPTDVLSFRSRVMNSLPEKSKILSITLENQAKVLFGANASDIESGFKSLDEIAKKSANTLLSEINKFFVLKYSDAAFDKNGITINGKVLPWTYTLTTEVEMAGTGGAKRVKLVWKFTQRQGARVQYGMFEGFDLAFELPQNLIDALSEFALERNVPQILNSSAPSSKEADGAQTGLK